MKNTRAPFKSKQRVLRERVFGGAGDAQDDCSGEVS